MTHPCPLPLPAFERDVDRDTLRLLVRDIAARPALWRPLVTVDAESRRFEQLWRDEHVDVWVISWMHGHDTGFHDHDLSQGAVAVVEGALLEERLVLQGLPLVRRHCAGAVFDFDASHVHRMTKDTGAPAVSIHAYSPPLWRMGTYATGADGTLRRQSVSYAEELRPVDTAA